MNVSDAIAEHAAKRPEQTAIVDGERQVSYGELELLVGRTATHLADPGVARPLPEAAGAAHGFEDFHDGWYYTDELAVRDGDGYIRIMGGPPT